MNKKRYIIPITNVVSVCIDSLLQELSVHTPDANEKEERGAQTSKDFDDNDDIGFPNLWED